MVSLPESGTLDNPCRLESRSLSSSLPSQKVWVGSGGWVSRGVVLWAGVSVASPRGGTMVLSVTFPSSHSSSVIGHSKTPAQDPARGPDKAS